VRNATGEPIARASVELLRPDGSVVAPRVSREMKAMLAREGRTEIGGDEARERLFFTDPDGRLTRRFIPPGRYTVEVTLDGHRTERREVRLDASRHSIDVTLVAR